MPDMQRKSIPGNINVNFDIVGGALASSADVELKERREATDCANNEFNRVKVEKLENERAKSRRARYSNNMVSVQDEKVEKQLDRERANRASAAASRAKIVCYARELEKRTDRLERERNLYAISSEKAIKKLRDLTEETKKLKDVLRNLWELKDPKTCSYLVDTNALFLLAEKDKGDAEEEDIDNDDTPTIVQNGINNNHNGNRNSSSNSIMKSAKTGHASAIAVTINSNIHSNSNGIANGNTSTTTNGNSVIPSIDRTPSHSTHSSRPPITHAQTQPSTSADYYPTVLQPPKPPQTHTQPFPPPLRQHATINIAATAPPPRLVPLANMNIPARPTSGQLLGPLPGLTPTPAPISVSGATVAASPPRPVQQQAPPPGYPAQQYAYPNASHNNNRQPYVLAPPLPREPSLARPFYHPQEHPNAHPQGHPQGTIPAMQIHPDEERRRLEMQSQQYQYQQKYKQQRR